MSRRRYLAAAVVAAALATGAGAAAGAGPNVQVRVLSRFDAAHAPAAVAATNSGDVVALAGPDVVSINPQGQQKRLTSISGGAFGIAIGIAYDAHHQLYAALPGSFGPPPHGSVLTVSSNGRQLAPLAGSDGMVAPDGFGLDVATGDMYVTDIFGMGIWRWHPGGPAQLWTSVATDPLLVLPDGVKVHGGAVYTSIEGGKILRIPINPDGGAGAATIWAHVDAPGVFFDDMVLDDRTGDVFVTRLDTNELLQITPAGAITTIASNADGLLGAANMVLTHVGKSTVIYLANGASDFLGTGATSSVGPSVLKITIR